jgi:hypothetical protein
MGTVEMSPGSAKLPAPEADLVMRSDQWIRQSLERKAARRAEQQQKDCPPVFDARQTSAEELVAFHEKMLSWQVRGAGARNAHCIPE